jgi:hypothetical protein
MSDGFKLYKMETALRNFLRLTSLCCVLANAGCGNGTSPVLSPTPTPRIDWGMSLLSGGTVGIGQFPAKFSFDVNAPPDCTNDFVVYNTSLNGSAGSVANIVAFNELYSTQGGAGGLCAQDGPSVYWPYFTGAGTAVTSVTLSLDGSKVSFVENGGIATLRILKWKAGEGSGAGSPACSCLALAKAAVYLYPEQALPRTALDSAE